MALGPKALGFQHSYYGPGSKGIESSGMRATVRSHRSRNAASRTERITLSSCKVRYHIRVLFYPQGHNFEGLLVGRTQGSKRISRSFPGLIRIDLSGAPIRL